MDSNSAVNHIDSPGQTSEWTPPSHQTGTAQAGLVNAQNIHIHVDTIVTNVKAEPSLEVLQKRVAPNAILNAGGRAGEVRCHPRTRTEVIARIEQWRKAEGDNTPPIFLLSGPAGAGKSAIMQTVAESCKEQGIPQANFFFFRGDTSRSHVSPLIPTLLYQITSLYPPLRDPIATLLSTDPEIKLDSRLEDQLRQLIVDPLCTIQRSSSVFRPLLLLIDGLHECDSSINDNQGHILLAFDRVLEGSKPLPPLRLLVASRGVSQIQQAFIQVSSKCRNLYLDEEFSPEDDIRVFVEAQFSQVRKTHSLAQTLGAAWPSADDVESIVKKSSGHYIYAVTVMRFILRSSASPILSLQRVQGAARLAPKSPFSHLDAIYTYILSQVDDQDALKDILHVHSFITHVQSIALPLMEPRIGNEVLIMDLLACLNKKYTKAAVHSCLDDLTSIARFATDSQELLFYHTSFSDYLFDESRSRDYFVNLATFDDKITPMIWQFIRDTNPGFEWLQFGLCAISLLKILPPSLMRLVSETPFHWRDWEMKGTIFQTIYNLCTHDDDIKQFRSIFAEWINSSRELDESHLDSIKDIPFGRMYYQMARARRGDALEPASLRPKTDLDRNDVSVWLEDFLRSRHDSIGDRDYKQLLKAWIRWAIENDIALNGIEDIPFGRMYYQMARAERGHLLDVEMATGLRPKTDLDRADLSSWLQGFLSRQKRDYNELLKTWIPWALENDIPLNVEDIPLGRMYYHMGRAERGSPLDTEMATSLRPETDLGRAVLSVWLLQFLSRRQQFIKRHDSEQFLKTWIRWAIENDVRLDGIEDIPFGRMYYQMARAERGSPLDVAMAAGLRPETDLDRADLSAWLQDFVTSRRQEINKREYKQLIKTWVPWAVVNDIPLGVLNNLPGTRWYIWRSIIKKWVGRGVLFKRRSRKK